MKKNSILAGALALSMLTACAPGVAEADDLAYQAADLRRDSTLITVDGQPITAEEYLFWLASAAEMYDAYGLLPQEDWGDLAETLKADALETAKFYRVIENNAARYGVTLTQEQEDQIKTEMEEAAANAGGQEVFLERLNQMCISVEGFEGLNRVYYLHQSLQEKLTESGELTVTDADVDAYIEEQGIYGAKHILISTRRLNEEGTGYEDFSDEEKAQALALAEELCEQLTQAGNSEELFDQLMNEYSEDGRDSEGNLYAPDGYTYVYPNQMVPEFEAGAKALEVGGISGPVQSDYGYHIILRVEVDREKALAKCGEDYQFSKLTQQWLDEAETVTTKAYDELDPEAFYNRLQELNAARAAAQAAQSSETPEESPAESVQPEG